MLIVVYSETNDQTLKENFGKSEYSYYFVLNEFLPVLRQLGTVTRVVDPDREVDAIYHRAAQAGEDCIFLSFSPPHRTPLGLACPTVPVFAWEFDTIPYETWFDEPFQDWRFVLNKLGRAITHSNFSAEAVRSAMGRGFSVASIPAPVWDRFAGVAAEPDGNVLSGHSSLTVAGDIIDTGAPDWVKHAVEDWSAADRPLQPDGESDPTNLAIDGVVYTSILSPYDHRKNFSDMLAAFCSTFRDVHDAILIIKLITHRSRRATGELVRMLQHLSPFKCRIILIDGYLCEAEYRRLMMLTTYAVNTSTGEGQCLPLMEYMSCGKPAVAPRHTAMLDYLSADNAFLVASTPEPGSWPHDPRGASRALRQRIDFASLEQAYEESYRVAKDTPAQYRYMAGQARHALERHCSTKVILDRLRTFLQTPRSAERRDDAYATLVPRDLCYVLESVIDFVERIDTRRFLRSGWSHLELGHGVWSDGPIAEIAVHIEPRPAAAVLFCANLSGYINPHHADIKVHVSANGVPVARWDFTMARYGDTQRSWRTALIPQDIAASRPIILRLQIEDPASPRSLGLSPDHRRLGVTLHRFTITRNIEAWS